MVKFQTHKLTGVFTSVLLTLLTAFILSYSAKNIKLYSITCILIFSLVIFLNIIKFLIWGGLNKKFDLSKTYPLTAIFYPLIFITAILTGDTIISIQKVLGLIFISFGVYYFERYGVDS